MVTGPLQLSVACVPSIGSVRCPRREGGLHSAIRPFGWGVVSAPGHEGIREVGSQSLQRPRGPEGLSARSRAVWTAGPSLGQLFAQPGWVEDVRSRTSSFFGSRATRGEQSGAVELGSGGLVLRVVDRLVGHHGPGDAGQLVGQSDGGQVEAAPLLQSQGPSGEADPGPRRACRRRRRGLLRSSASVSW